MQKLKSKKELVDYQDLPESYLPPNKLSEDEVAGKAPSYYEESESEYESEEDEASEIVL